MYDTVPIPKPIIMENKCGISPYDKLPYPVPVSKNIVYGNGKSDALTTSSFSLSSSSSKLYSKDIVRCNGEESHTTNITESITDGEQYVDMGSMKRNNITTNCNNTISTYINHENGNNDDDASEKNSNCDKYENAQEIYYASIANNNEANFETCTPAATYQYYNEVEEEERASFKSVALEMDKLMQKPEIYDIFNRRVSSPHNHKKNKETNDIYDYINDANSSHIMKVYHSYKRVFLFGFFCSIPSYVIIVIACTLLFYDNGIKNNNNNTNDQLAPSSSGNGDAGMCLNMTTDELEYLSLLVSRPFLDTFNIDTGNNDAAHIITYPLDEEERRFLIRSMLSNINLFMKKRELNSPKYLEYYVNEIIKYSNSQTCCSERLCKFQKQLKIDETQFEMYTNNIDVFYRHYAYGTKLFCNAYVLIMYNRFLHVWDTPNTDTKQFVRSIMFDIMNDNSLLYLISTHVMQYVSSNKFCK